MTRRLLLRDLTGCSLDDQMAVLTIRNDPDVRKYMYTERLISDEEHLSYIEKLRSSQSARLYVVISEDNRPIGAVGLTGLDRFHARTDWAFYVSSDGRGLGKALEWNTIEHVFFGLGLEKLNCEVIETNPAICALHKSFGFVEEGFRRSNVVNGGKRAGVHLFGLTKSDWVAGRSAVLASMSDRIESVVVEFEPRSASQTV